VGLRFAHEFDYEFFDDDACSRFIERYFVPSVGALFRDIVAGPHKADLFRYCYLYAHFILMCVVDHVFGTCKKYYSLVFIVYFCLVFVCRLLFISGMCVAEFIWTLKPN
jgi:hypothetical protein